MIAPFRFLWKQLNGPQITAICTAIFRYLKRQLDTTLDYLNTFSVDTANDDHLSLIGMIAGLVRPIIDFAPSTMFWFTDHGPLHNSGHGLADLEERSIGGRFSDLNDPVTTSVHELLPAHYYRKLLKAWTDNDFDGTSLAFLDTVLDIIWKDMRRTDSAYVINIRDSVATIENRSYGDVEIDLGNAADWEDRITYVRGMLVGIATTLYNPIPRIFPDFDDEE